MNNKISKNFALTPAQPEAGKAFRRAGKRKAATEYDEAQEALAREAEKSNEN